MLAVYDSFDLVPLDQPGIDGDDSLVPGEFGAIYEDITPLQLQTSVAQTLVVPFFPLQANSRSPAVVALARALWRAGFLYKAPGVPFTPLLGPAKQIALKRFKAQHHLPSTAVYDRTTLGYLAPYYDALALSILHVMVTPPLTPADKIRLAKVAAGNFIYNHRMALAYTQRRPWSVTKIPNLPYPGLDCSAGEAWCDLNAGGIHEPSGYQSWGWGNTWTQLARYRQLGRAHTPSSIMVKRAKLGDPIYYDGHVAWVIATGSVPLVWSYGGYPLQILKYDYRDDAVAICDLL